MPQLSLYIDEETIRKIEVIAKQQHISLSKWVRSVINKELEKNEWPEHYFDLFGSINDESFSKPEELSIDQDIQRESI